MEEELEELLNRAVRETGAAGYLLRAPGLCRCRGLAPEQFEGLEPHWEPRRRPGIVTCGFDVGLEWGLLAMAFERPPHPQRRVERWAARLGRCLRRRHEKSWRARLHGTVCQELTAARFEIEPLLPGLPPEQREGLERGCRYLSRAAVSLRELLR